MLQRRKCKANFKGYLIPRPSDFVGNERGLKLMTF